MKGPNDAMEVTRVEVTKESLISTGTHQHVRHVGSDDVASQWHLCGWIEHIPGGTRQNDGLETGITGAMAARLAVGVRAPSLRGDIVRRV